MPKQHTLFISDLHLSHKNPCLYEHFSYFMKEIAPKAQALYILGDLFEVWLGLDVKTSFYQNVFDLIHQLKMRGTQIYFMKGNRDFLIHKKALTQMDIILLSDPCLVTLYGKKILLTHGDRLCTLDVAYQRYRRVANIKALQWLFLHTPASFREKLALKIHKKNPHKEEALHLEYILADATNSAILKDFNRFHADYLVHGHTHRMGLHWHQDKLRVVLGDWKQDYFNYLYISSDQVLLNSINK